MGCDATTTSTKNQYTQTERERDREMQDTTRCTRYLKIKFCVCNFCCFSFCAVKTTSKTIAVCVSRGQSEATHTRTRIVFEVKSRGEVNLVELALSDMHDLVLIIIYQRCVICELLRVRVCVCVRLRAAEASHIAKRNINLSKRQHQWWEMCTMHVAIGRRNARIV